MPSAVLDAGVAIRWFHGDHPTLPPIDRLMRASREGTVEVWISTVNLAEFLIHARDAAKVRGTDPVAFMKGYGVLLHPPDEAIANRVASLDLSLADAFATATAMELGARLHTTDRELAARLKGRRIAVTLY